jgi:uncharacterized protein YbjQ (UPF0145 family)
VPGYRIRSVLGEVVGVTARTHNPFSEGVKGMDGRSNPQLGIALLRWREDAVRKMVEAAAAMGANAIVGMRFDNRWITTLWSEICAYGTAVQVSLIPEELPPSPAAPGAPPPAAPPPAPDGPPGPPPRHAREDEERSDTPAAAPASPAPAPVKPDLQPPPVSPIQPGSGPVAPATDGATPAADSPARAPDGPARAPDGPAQAADGPAPEPPAPRRRPSPTPH